MILPFLLPGMRLTLDKNGNRVIILVFNALKRQCR